MNQDRQLMTPNMRVNLTAAVVTPLATAANAGRFLLRAASGAPSHRLAVDAPAASRLR